MYGVLGAYIHHYYYHFWVKYRWYFFYIGLIGVGSYYFTNIEQNKFYRWIFSFSVTSITILGFLPILSLYKIEKNKIFRNIVLYISLISYSLYLINMPISNALLDFINWDYIVENFLHSWALAKFINYILFWLISIVLATLIYKYYELPTINYFRNKIK